MLCIPKPKLRSGIAAELNDAELSGELGAPLDSIRTQHDWISVKFSGNDESSYEIETRLLLFLTGDKPIGWYCCHENENGEHLDDFLVFE